jgi:SpoVK/Ycf46/Vps4 family AAA+-type ATPase
MDAYGQALFRPCQLLIDDLIDFAGSLPAQILEELHRFWSLGERFRKFGFLHRRGYLLYGKQGTGKSSLIHQLIGRVIDQGNVAIYCQSPHSFVVCMEQLRTVEPDRAVVCIFEDIDAMVGQHGTSSLLHWLDGNSQIDNVVNIATTNYPERLDRRLTARPRRFDRLIRIDPPDARARDAYFARKLPDLFAEERRRWVDISEGLTFAALAELIISVCCLEKGLEESATLLKELDSQTPSAEEYERLDNGLDDGDDESATWTPCIAERQRSKSEIPF